MLIVDGEHSEFKTESGQRDVEQVKSNGLIILNAPFKLNSDMLFAARLGIMPVTANIILSTNAHALDVISNVTFLLLIALKFFISLPPCDFVPKLTIALSLI